MWPFDIECEIDNEFTIYLVPRMELDDCIVKDSPFRGQTVPHREGVDGAGRDFTYNRLESTALDSTVRG